MSSRQRTLSSYEVDSITELLVAVTLQVFVTEHFQRLYNHTCNPEVFGRELLRQRIIKDQNQLDECMNPPGTFGKNKEFYKRIIEADDCRGYIKALEATENFGILNFIKEKLLRELEAPSNPKNPDISPAIDSMATPIANLTISQNRFVPSTAECELLARKLKKVVNYIDLKNNFEGVPLEEIFDGYSTHLNKSTIITDNLVTLLKDMRVLDEGAASKIMKTKDTEHVVCCNTIYDRLFKNRNVDYLIHMWEKTTNNGLISWTKNWLDAKYPQF